MLIELVLPIPEEELAMKTGENSVDHFLKKMQIAVRVAYSHTRGKLQVAAEMTVQPANLMLKLLTLCYLNTVDSGCYATEAER